MATHDLLLQHDYPYTEFAVALEDGTELARLPAGDRNQWDARATAAIKAAIRRLREIDPDARLGKLRHDKPASLGPVCPRKGVR